VKEHGFSRNGPASDIGIGSATGHYDSAFSKRRAYSMKTTLDEEGIGASKQRIYDIRLIFYIALFRSRN
jgi:hypothetical protein